MFTDQAQQLLDQAKRDSLVQGASELTLDSLVTAAAQHPEGRVLLARCLNLSVEQLQERYRPSVAQTTLYPGKLPLSRDVQTVIAQAQQLAAQVPDQLHPGLVGLRHLAAALAMSWPACQLLGASAITERDALQQLAAWYDSDAQTPELSELAARIRALRDELLSKVFGQDHAVHAFVEGLFNSQVTAYADTGRRTPQVVFVFAGPPGVGKTYLAELGAAYLGRPFRRFDMSSYSDHQQHLTLVGWAPSYQAAQPGLLTGFVEQNPNAFLLFDEIEKAHLNTVNLFLQILDAGHLDDKFTGQDVSFRDTVIIFTTNAGASLYDRPNETGINAANATFHRRTILDALRTETRPDGEPFFPPTICSRLSTGYPVLFNHLGINELERIARVEIERVGELIQQQYYKMISFDDRLPLALVLREGDAADARTVRSQSATFVKGEIFRFSELYTRRHLEQAWDAVDTIHFTLDLPAGESADVAGLFEPSDKPRVLLIALPELCALFQHHIPEVTWLTASTAQDALQVLATAEVDLVLLDIWLGRSPDTLTTTTGQFDYVPAGAQALSEGQECLRRIHERLPGMPVYLLSLAGPDAEEGSIDEALFLACVRSGGARGVLTSSFTSSTLEGWQEARERFVEALQQTALRMHREKKARELAQQRRVLIFDTVPAVDRTRRQVTIRARNLRIARAVAAADAAEVLEEVERPTVRFSDVFGADAAKEALQFVVDWLRNPRRYAALGVRPPKGILLYGPPGTGKTMLARALAGESDVAFIVASGTDFVTIWQGSGPQNVRDLFARARRYAPSIVFIDELDAIGRKRVGMVGAGRAEESTLNALLVEMEGFGEPTLRPVILLAATNLAELLDDALRRRFDREIEVQPPDRAARAAFLRHQLLGRQYCQVSEAVLDSLAVRSAGMTISDLLRVINEAGVMAARRGTSLTDAILEEAFEKMRMGEAGKMPDPATLERIARHEAGHALIGWLGGNTPMQVTIVGRGSAGGYVEREIQEEKVIYTRPELEQLICQTMGGRAAELLYYGEAEGLSTGASGDLRQATYWAERMIREFGMSEAVGQVFLDPAYMQEGQLASRVSEAAESIVRAQLDRALTLLHENADRLDRLATELLSKNRLTREEVETILAAE